MNLWNIAKYILVISIVILIIFVIFSGRFGQFSPIMIIIVLLVLASFIIFIFWRYKQTTLKPKVKRDSHWEYLKDQMERNNVPGVIQKDDGNSRKNRIIINKPKMRFSIIAGGHHLASFRDKNSVTTSFYDIDNDYDRGAIWDDNLESKTSESLIDALKIVEQIEKGETLKVIVTPAQVEKIYEREVPAKGTSKEEGQQ